MEFEKEILMSMKGKTVEYVNVVQSEEDDRIGSCCIVFADGTRINIGCASYNYGQQDLVISDKGVN